MACSDIDMMTDESWKDDMMTDDNWEDDMMTDDNWEDEACTDSSDIYVALKAGGINSLAEYELRTATYKEEENNRSEFPIDIIMRVDMKIKDVAKRHVLPFLPAKSLMKFRAVSKEWNQWIASPLLAYNQSSTFQKLSGYFYQGLGIQGGPPIFLSLQRSTNGVPSPSLAFLPEDVKVLSSSSGLLLCQGEESYYVCNPATKAWKKLPPPQYYHGSDPAVVLAFDPQCNIESFYYVVAAVLVLDHPFICFEIYCSESDSWRLSPSDCLELENTSLAAGGYYMKGVAYWRNTSSNEVLAFDVKHEIPAVLHVPIIQPEQCGALAQIGDEVCYVTAHNHSGNVFIIDIYGGVDMDLKKSVSVNLGRKKPRTQVVGGISKECCEVLPCTDGDTVVIHTDTKIYFYHLKEKKVETFQSPGRVDTHKRFLPYINSLAMVHRSEEEVVPCSDSNTVVIHGHNGILLSPYGAED